ncbi:MAG: hypothetical protein OXS50_07885 [Gammaproteobacteria bacterium]|nr:hypothetical protein [Gammaproteobacteria bacterium]
MTEYLIDVLDSGAVCLGSSVVCDGFADGFEFRVQTHIHDDHMAGFDRSKGLQDLLMNPETHALLVAERNADLEYRDNLLQLPRGAIYVLRDGSELSLHASGHMLGSCQVAVHLLDGPRVGYSGDFGWPLDHVIQVDQLVVDSTYGSPNSIRNYSQSEAEQCLREVVGERLRHGPVHIKAFRGTIERVLHVLEGSIGVPILASDRLVREVQVYQMHGFAVGSLETLDSYNGRSALTERSYVRLYSKGDGFGNELADGTSITCSAYMATSDHPLMRYSDRAYRVALSNHADFNETLAYIEASGASKVITDNTRNHGRELAIAINSRFPHVHAQPSTNNLGPRWS